MTKDKQEPLGQRFLWGLLGLAVMIAVTIPLVAVTSWADAWLLPMRKSMVTGLASLLRLEGPKGDAWSAFLLFDAVWLLVGIALATAYNRVRSQRTRLIIAVLAGVVALGFRYSGSSILELLSETSWLFYQKLALWSLMGALPVIGWLIVSAPPSDPASTTSAST